MSVLHPLAADAPRIQPWANGLGSTIQLACGPDDAHWRWRLSVAQIGQASAFSPLPGVRRWIAPLDAPLELAFPAGGKRLLPRLAVHAFDGADAPFAELPEGPARAFNLMLRGDARAELIARPLHGAMVLPAAAGGRWFVHLPAGQAEVRADAEAAMLAAGGSLWIDAQPGQRLRIEGGGEIVLAKLAD
ncbi:hypothetical protein ASG87_07315 [Frateuria sp. Soil773]|uniref:HutD/Ves family protein n=1 Tax=Frateuria sp. Soil773 TaxID=1736407 RepID=UPI0007006AC1|nr:HutD family protein [Frateuria sp. Soil773]KRE88411.1 hypothetical protein ASG87_07315 [Frateuria sp. Soil773]